jgi:putative heme-binding domain-containing protein
MPFPSRFLLQLTLGLGAACALGAAETPAPAAPKPAAAPAAEAPKAPGFTAWELGPLVPIVNRNLNAGRSFARGKELFTKLGCSICHSFGGGETEGVGGIGPDLTGVGGRYGVRDILDSIISPSNAVSNLFAAMIVRTTDGKQLTGKVMYEDDKEVALAENIFDLTKLTKIPRASVDDMEESKTSLMPPGLINGSSAEEISDLLAFLISGGDANNRMFRPAPAAPAAK